MDFPAKLNRRHKAVLFLALLAAGASLVLGADVKQTVGAILLGIALAWVFGSDSRIVHGLLVALSLAVLLVGFFWFYLPHAQDEKQRNQLSVDEPSEVTNILDGAVTPPQKSPGLGRFTVDGEPLSDEEKHNAWHLYWNANDPQELQALFHDLNIASETKKQLADLKSRSAQAHKPVPKLRTLARGLGDREFWFDETPGLLLLGLGVALLRKVRPRHG